MDKITNKLDYLRGVPGGPSQHLNNRKYIYICYRYIYTTFASDLIILPFIYLNVIAAHFGAKLLMSFAAFWSPNFSFAWYLQHFGAWISCWQSFRSILEPAFAQYYDYVYIMNCRLKSLICMVFAAF